MSKFKISQNQYDKYILFRQAEEAWRAIQDTQEAIEYDEIHPLDQASYTAWCNYRSSFRRIPFVAYSIESVDEQDWAQDISDTVELNIRRDNYEIVSPKEALLFQCRVDT